LRLFIAGKILCDKLKDLQKEIDVKGVKLVKDFHYTLKFLGDVSEDKVNLIDEKLSSINFKKFDCSFDDVGFFPNEDYVKVIWVGLEPSGKFIDLHEKIDESLKDLFEKDNRFKSHVTLGRVRFIANKEEFKNKLNYLKSKKIDEKFNVSKFYLINSVLQEEGHVYHVLKEYGLK